MSIEIEKIIRKKLSQEEFEKINRRDLNNLIESIIKNSKQSLSTVLYNKKSYKIPLNSLFKKIKLEELKNIICGIPIQSNKYSNDKYPNSRPKTPYFSWLQLFLQSLEKRLEPKIGYSKEDLFLLLHGVSDIADLPLDIIITLRFREKNLVAYCKKKGINR